MVPEKRNETDEDQAVTEMATFMHLRGSQVWSEVIWQIEGAGATDVNSHWYDLRVIRPSGAIPPK